MTLASRSAAVPVRAGDLAARLADLEAIGAGQRVAWTPGDAAARRWFAQQATAIGLHVTVDPAGNLWGAPRAPSPWWAVGAHLDGPPGGGRCDGALGIVAALAVAERASRPVAVVCFADGEGARFDTPAFGSAALTGALDVEAALARVDDDGVVLADALREAGLDPARLADATAWLVRLAGLVELQVDRGGELDHAGAAVGVVGELAAQLRVRVDVQGRGDHVGAVPRAERADALLAAAQLITAADALGAGIDGLVGTATRIDVEPNAATTVPARVRLWLDARAPTDAAVDVLLGRVRAYADRLACRADVHVLARTPSTTLDADVRATLAAAAPADAPQLRCLAGHDAGIIGRRRPAGLVLVRNPAGAAHAALEDAALGANVVLDALERIA